MEMKQVTETLSYGFEKHGADVLIKINGKAEINTIQYTREILFEQQGKDVIIDVEELETLNSTWLGALFKKYHEVRAGGGTLTIRKPNKMVNMLITTLIKPLPGSGFQIEE